MAWDCYDIFCHFPWCKHFVHLGGQPLYPGGVTDMGMAENRADIPCRGDLSGHRVSDLDHIISSNTEKTV
ncbi:unnamed protein product [Prunus armeniaca]|uniref:Uncharacterized protein n=1 Tax=Prunus armeniaca TaxID=36596 RepID=A0A6J5UGF4_PRUAR|nr:unnamed protein product [Prunus armeniaca]CAB4304942.1 unnamed protein product [Prunus armeniaca]